MFETYFTANVLEAAVEDTTIIIETFGEAAEDMAAVEEAIIEEAMVYVAIMIMATIATEMIIIIPSSSLPRVFNNIEMNHNPKNR